MVTSSQHRLRGEERRRARLCRVGECGRKARYATAAYAAAALRLLRDAGRERGVQHVYGCPHCGCFHVGRDQTAPEVYL